MEDFLTKVAVQAQQDTLARFKFAQGFMASLGRMLPALQRGAGAFRNVAGAGMGMRPALASAGRQFMRAGGGQALGAGALGLGGLYLGGRTVGAGMRDAQPAQPPPYRGM